METALCMRATQSESATAGPSSAVLTADVLSQWQSQAAATDAKQAAHSHSQWKLVRDQVSAFSEELVALCSEMRLMRRELHTEVEHRASVEDELTQKLKLISESLEHEAKLRVSTCEWDTRCFSELSQEVQELKKQLPTSEQRSDESSGSWRIFQEEMHAHLHDLRHEIQQGASTSRQEFRHEIQQSAITSRQDFTEVLAISNQELRLEFQQGRGRPEAQAQVDAKCEEVGKLAAVLMTSFERVSFELRESDQDASRRFIKLSEELEMERQERAGQIDALQAMVSASARGPVRQSRCADPSCSATDTQTPGCSLADCTPSLLWKSLHSTGDSDFLDMPSCVASPGGRMVDDLRKCADKVHTDEASLGLQRMQARLDMEAKERSRSDAAFSEQLKTVSESLGLEVAGLFDEVRKRLEEHSSSFQQDLAAEKQERLQQAVQMQSSLGCEETMTQVRALQEALQSTVDQTVESMTRKCASPSIDDPSAEEFAMVRQTLETEQLTRAKESEALWSSMQGLETELKTLIRSLNGALEAHAESEFCALRKDFDKEKQLREEDSSRLSVTLQHLEAHLDSDISARALEVAGLDERLKLLPDATSLQMEDKDDGMAQRLDDLALSLRKEVLAERDERINSFSHLQVGLKDQCACLKELHVLVDGSQHQSSRLDDTLASVHQEILVECEERAKDRVCELQQCFQEELQLLKDEIGAAKAARMQDISMTLPRLDALQVRLDTSETQVHAVCRLDALQEQIGCISDTQADFADALASVTAQVKSVERVALSAPGSTSKDELGAAKAARIQDISMASPRLNVLQVQLDSTSDTQAHFAEALASLTAQVKCVERVALAAAGSTSKAGSSDQFAQLSEALGLEIKYLHKDVMQQVGEVRGEVASMRHEKAKKFKEVWAFLESDQMHQLLKFADIHGTSDDAFGDAFDRSSAGCKLREIDERLNLANQHRETSISNASAEWKKLLEASSLKVLEQMEELSSRLEAISSKALQEHSFEGEQCATQEPTLESMIVIDEGFEIQSALKLEDLQAQLEFEARARSRCGAELAAEVKALAELLDLETSRRVSSQEGLSVALRNDRGEQVDTALAELASLRRRMLRLEEHAAPDNFVAEARAVVEAEGENASAILKMQCMIEAERCERAQALVDVLERLGSLSAALSTEKCQGEEDLSGRLIILEERVASQLQALRLGYDLEAAERDEKLEASLMESQALRCQLQGWEANVSQQVSDLWAGLEVEAGERCSASARLQERCDELQSRLSVEVDRGLQSFLHVLDQESAAQHEQQHALRTTGELLRSAESLLGGSGQRAKK